MRARSIASSRSCARMNVTRPAVLPANLCGFWLQHVSMNSDKKNALIHDSLCVGVHSHQNQKVFSLAPNHVLLKTYREQGCWESDFLFLKDQSFCFRVSGLEISSDRRNSRIAVEMEERSPRELAIDFHQQKDVLRSEIECHRYFATRSICCADS